MPLDKCRECNEIVSSSALICPHCGIGKPVPNKSNKVTKKLLLYFFLFFIFIISSSLIYSMSESGKGKTGTLTPAEIRDNRIKEQFNAWDGSHFNLERFIKNSMKDPDSYEHVETRYSDKGNYLLILTTFRGKNSFGGKEKRMVRAKVSLEGKVLKVFDKF